MDKNTKLPFFASFLEAQDIAQVEGGRRPVTLKYPSDNDEYAETMKYPSDSDEAGSSI